VGKDFGPIEVFFMKINETASAGSPDSNDAIVTVSPGKGRREIEIESSVALLFSGAIEREIMYVLDSYSVDDVTVKIVDRGALDFVIQSRLETALLRAGGSK
jgi:citrate lyase subunit gamma (acyl carrier protein)